jgi:hypothetical protein
VSIGPAPVRSISKIKKKKQHYRKNKTIEKTTLYLYHHMFSNSISKMLHPDYYARPLAVYRIVYEQQNIYFTSLSGKANGIATIIVTVASLPVHNRYAIMFSLSLKMFQ